MTKPRTRFAALLSLVAVVVSGLAMTTSADLAVDLAVVLGADTGETAIATAGIEGEGDIPLPSA